MAALSGRFIYQEAMRLGNLYERFTFLSGPIRKCSKHRSATRWCCVKIFILNQNLIGQFNNILLTFHLNRVWLSVGTS